MDKLHVVNLHLQGLTPGRYLQGIIESLNVVTMSASGLISRLSKEIQFGCSVEKTDPETRDHQDYLEKINELCYLPPGLWSIGR